MVERKYMAKKKKKEQETKVPLELEQVAGYLSVREAAHILCVSERSVYSYIGSQKLRGARIGNILVVHQEDIDHMQRRPPGRLRSRSPRWRLPPAQNSQLLTTITVRLRPGENPYAALLDKLAQIRRENRHNFSGTVFRSIVRNQNDPDEIEIFLAWREAISPAIEEKEAALAALTADLADVLDWSTATTKECLTLLHAQ